jgi:hypothetical protein
MTTISHEPSHVAREQRRWWDAVVTDMWASLAIIVIWLGVLIDAIFGPDILTNGAGGDSAVIPSAVVLAFFGFFATWVIAKYGFRRDRAE